MQTFKVADNANPDGTSKNREGVVAGTSIMSDFLNDNFFNLFEFLTSQGYTLIDGDTSQFAKANKSLYNSTYIYNTSGIATQTVSDIVEGSDGYYYQVLLDNIIDDDPVGSVTGAWKKVNYDKSLDINQLTSVASPENLSEFVMADSLDTFNLKKINWFSIKAAMKQYLNYSYVPIAGNSTITGIKTFSESPTAPAPTTALQVANKDYVDINTKIAKQSLINTDEFMLADSANTFILKKISFSNLKATLKTYFDVLYGNFVANDSRVKTALNASGSAPIYGARAWVNFRGTGTVAIRASGNVSSITDNGTGDYTVNFITAMEDANYTLVGSADRGAGGTTAANIVVNYNNSSTYVPTASSVRINTSRPFDSDSLDSLVVNIAIFR